MVEGVNEQAFLRVSRGAQDLGASMRLPGTARGSACLLVSLVGLWTQIPLHSYN